MRAICTLLAQRVRSLGFTAEKASSAFLWLFRLHTHHRSVTGWSLWSLACVVLLSFLLLLPLALSRSAAGGSKANGHFSLFLLFFLFEAGRWTGQQPQRSHCTRNSKGELIGVHCTAPLRDARRGGRAVATATDTARGGATTDTQSHSGATSEQRVSGCDGLTGMAMHCNAHHLLICDATAVDHFPPPSHPPR